MVQSPVTSVLSVRISSDERALLEDAASQARTNLSDFVRRRALEAAEIDVLSRGVVTISAKDWERFEAWLERPATTIAAIQQLASRTPSWER